jgi:hypothetical protein
MFHHFLCDKSDNRTNLEGVYEMPDFSFVLWGLLFVAAVVVMVIKKDLRNSAVAMMNCDFENVPPFFCRLSSIFDAGFKVSDVHLIQLAIEEMKEDNEVKELGTYSVRFQGKKMKIYIQAKLQLDLQDHSKEVVLILSSHPEVVQAIKKVMRRYAEEYEM